MPRGYLKNAPGVSANLARGNGSKKDQWYYMRRGAGAKGRRHQGNSARIPSCCPCHPSVEYSYARRVACREATARSASAAMHGRQDVGLAPHPKLLVMLQKREARLHEARLSLLRRAMRYWLANRYDTAHPAGQAFIGNLYDEVMAVEGDAA